MFTRNGSGGAGTYSDQLVFGARGEVLAIRAETNAPNVEVSVQIYAVILENTQFLAGADFVDLSGSVTAGGDEFPIRTEPHATDNTLMLQCVEQIHIEGSRDLLVENNPPVVFHLLAMHGDTLWI